MDNFLNKLLKKNWSSVFFVCFLGALVYSVMLPAPFKTLDDNFSIVGNAMIQDLANAKKVFNSSFFESGHYYRPLVALTFMLEYHFFKLDSFYYNLTNMLLHLSSAATIFFLIIKLMNNRKVAFFTALLFAVHPIHWEAAANISGRSILLSAFFGLNSFLFYMLAKEQKSVWLYGGSLMLFGLSLLSKESAVMLPIILLSHIIFLENKREGRRSFLSSAIKVVPYFGIILFYIFARKSMGLMEVYVWPSFEEMVLGFLTFLRSCLTHLRLFVFPLDLHFDRSRMLFSNYFDLELRGTIFIFVMAGAFFIKQRKIFPGYVLFFFSWFWIDLFPVSQIIAAIGIQPGYISTAEHFLYMSSVGIFVLMAAGVQQLRTFEGVKKQCSPEVFQIVIIGILVFFMLITVQQNLHARSAVAMFERSIQYQPNNARMQYSLGIEKGIRGYPEEAEKYFRRSLAIEPRKPIARIGLGKALCDQGKYWQGIQEYEKVSHPKRLEGLLKENLRLAYARIIERYQKRLIDEPDNAQLHFSLGVMYSKTNKIDEAIKQYKRALQLDPKHKNAAFNLDFINKAFGDDK